MKRSLRCGLLSVTLFVSAKCVKFFLWEANPGPNCLRHGLIESLALHWWLYYLTFQLHGDESQSLADPKSGSGMWGRGLRVLWGGYLACKCESVPNSWVPESGKVLVLVGGGIYFAYKWIFFMFMVLVRGRLENNFANVSFDYGMNLSLDLSISNCLLCWMQMRPSSLTALTEEMMVNIKLYIFEQISILKSSYNADSFWFLWNLINIFVFLNICLSLSPIIFTKCIFPTM